MVIYVTESGSDRTELVEALKDEGVSFKESSRQTVRESSTAGWRMVEVQANLQEVIPVPPEYTQGDVDARAWRLPSGRMIISDMEGNLEQITPAPPPYGR
ncbi:MAG: hypothetical protein P8168_14650 [Deltaproteobacteria bacterium]|jgi:hypothetical protein